MTFSKKLTVFMNVFCATLTMATFVVKCFGIETMEILFAVIPLWASANGFYTYKAKAENVAKISAGVLEAPIES